MFENQTQSDRYLQELEKLISLDCDGRDELSIIHDCATVGQDIFGAISAWLLDINLNTAQLSAYDLALPSLNTGTAEVTSSRQLSLLASLGLEVASDQNLANITEPIVIAEPNNLLTFFQSFGSNNLSWCLGIPITTGGQRQFLIFGFDSRLQPSSMVSSVGKLFQNILEQKLLVANLQRDFNNVSHQDYLTGLPNRSWLNTKLSDVHSQSEQNNLMYALFVIDLDRFKVINDIYGHHMGDQLLNDIAKRIARNLPEKALLTRMGGDEFLVLLPHLENLDDASICANRIHSVFSDYFILAEQEIMVSASVGFAVFPVNGGSPRELLNHAELALHRAKERGGGNIQQYRMGQPLFYTMQPKLQSQLRKAIKNGELELYLQPIVNIHNKKIVSSEALVRWRHPEMGVLLPGSFVGQAEESGLVVEIGQWVISEVCKLISAWKKAGKTSPSISINLSPRELLSPNLVNFISRVIQEHQVNPNQIKIELTETFLIKNIEHSIKILEQLKELGLRILIDDFGTGYASLTYLKRLPVHAVKIDQSFIKGVPLNLKDTALTSTIISIAHQLGLSVVSEGVENVDQHDFLRAAKCDFGQGYLFHEPLPVEEFAKLF